MEDKKKMKKLKGWIVLRKNGTPNRYAELGQPPFYEIFVTDPLVGENLDIVRCTITYEI